MSLMLATRQEMGSLRVVAVLEAPCVHLKAPDPEHGPVLLIEESVIAIELDFTDAESLKSFQRQLTHLEVPHERT